MHDLRQTQEDFANALRSARGPLPDIFERPSGLGIAKRFDVYRNNVRSSLIEALEQTFPAVNRLVGTEYFKAVAVIFIEHNLPRHGTLIGYGEGFPEFLEGREELASFPYLGDVARLELAWLSAYHAADVRPLGGDDLSAVAPESVDNLVLQLHPSVHLLSPSLPVYEIWKRNLEEDVSPISLGLDEEHLLIFRLQIDVTVTQIPPDVMAFLSACSAKRTIREALADSQKRNPAFDLTQTFSWFLLQGLFTAFQISEGNNS
jgi:hypothetical protein